MWDTETGSLVREFSVGAGVIVASAFSADGARVLVAGNRGGGGVWDAATGTRVASFDGHTGIVYVAAFSRDGTSVLTADRVAGRRGRSCSRMRAAVRNGRRGSRSSRRRRSIPLARGWPPEASEPRASSTPAQAGCCTSCAVTGATSPPCGSGATDRRSSPRARRASSGYGISPHCPSWCSADSAMPPWDRSSARTESGSSPRVPPNAVVWDAARGTKIAEVLKIGHMAAGNARAAFDGQGRLMLGDQRVSAPETREVRTPSGDAAFFVRPPAGVRLVPQPRRAAHAPAAGGSLRDHSRSRLVAAGRPAEGPPGPGARRGLRLGCAMGPDSEQDSTARVWDVATGRQLQEFRLDNRGHAAGLSPDGRLAYVVEDWSTIKVWDTATWQRVHTFRWPESGGTGRRSRSPVPTARCSWSATPADRSTSSTSRPARNGWRWPLTSTRCRRWRSAPTAASSSPPARAIAARGCGRPRRAPAGRRRVPVRRRRHLQAGRTPDRHARHRRHRAALQPAAIRPDRGAGRGGASACEARLDAWRARALPSRAPEALTCAPGRPSLDCLPEMISSAGLPGGGESMI